MGVEKSWKIRNVAVTTQHHCLTLVGKVNDKQAETVAKKMVELMKRVPGAKIITLGNGGEFAMHKAVAEASNADIFFAKPYASYQRGTNENTNGIIRRTWPKKMAMGELTEQEVSDMELM